MSRVNALTNLQPNALDVIEDSKKVIPSSIEALSEAVTQMERSALILENKIGCSLEQEDKDNLIQIAKDIEETLNDLSQDPSFDNLDVLIMKRMIQALERQRSIREKGEKINLSELLFQQKRQESLNDEFLNIKHDAAKTQKMVKNFEKASIVTGIIVVGCAIGVALTGGAGALVPLAIGAAGLSNGAVQIGKSVLDHEKNKQLGNLASLSHMREEISMGMHDEMESVSDAVRGVMRSWDDLRELLSRRNEAIENLH